MMQSMTKILTMTTGAMSKIQICQLAILARLVMAVIFWKSAMTKIAFNAQGMAEFSLAQIWHVISLNWTVADSTYMLFEYEYDLPVIPFDWAANLAVAAEILLPIALFLGFFTRYAALAMLGMTLVIQVFVYPDLWTVHGLWAIALLVIMSKGGGRLSLDRVICGKCL
ncbi:MAG: DoxX family protein [Emcibacter sp.]|nr:DoxX family protein [Emcibacter sp.]